MLIVDLRYSSQSLCEKEQRLKRQSLSQLLQLLHLNQYYNQLIMKRALALLEQTKATMPHLPRPVSGHNDSHSSGRSDHNNDSDAEGKTAGSKPLGLKYRKAPK